MAVSRSIFCFIIAFFIFLLPVLGLSQEATAVNNTLNEINISIEDLENQGFSTQRLSDLYIMAKQQYAAQVALEKAGGSPDYSLVKDKINEINSLKEKALLLSDELNALDLRLEESEVNITEARNIYKEAVKEFEDERYEKAEQLIEKTYAKLSELESREARLSAFYESVSKNIENFFRQNLRKIILIIITLIAVLIILHNRINIYRLNRKLKILELRRSVLQELIAKTQKDYFEKGIIGEDTYNVRVKRFGELIRDLNRQIPLLKEKIAKIEKSGEKEDKKTSSIRASFPYLR